MPQLLRFTFTAMIVGVVLTPIARAQPADEPIEIKGEIVADDPVDPVRKVPGHVHEVKLFKGKAYLITLVSEDFDAYLRLADAAGMELASDDDSGGGSNARIKFTPTGDDMFKFHVTSFAGGTGKYTLTILGPGAVAKKVVAKKNPNPGKAEVLLDINGQIQANDAADPVRNHPGKVHEVKLKKGVRYHIDMTSGDFDSYLRLTDPAGTEVARDDDGGGFPHARIIYTPSAEGAFKIFATTYGGGVGNYKLVCKSDGPVVKDGVIALAAPAAGKPATTNNQLQQNDKADPIRRHPSKVFSVELKKGKTYVIDMTAGFDTYLRFEGPNGQQIAQDDDGGEGLNSRIVFNCTDDGAYRIIATSFSGGTGEFNLSVAEQ